LRQARQERQGKYEFFLALLASLAQKLQTKNALPKFNRPQSNLAKNGWIIRFGPLSFDRHFLEGAAR
jgi:hypothetical protein